MKSLSRKPLFRKHLFGLAVILMLNTAVAVYAKEAMIPQISGYPLPLSDGAEEKLSDDTTEVRAKGFEIPGDKLLTGLVLKDLDEPVPGKPFDTAATITSEEGTAWDISEPVSGAIMACILTWRIRMMSPPILLPGFMII